MYIEGKKNNIDYQTLTNHHECRFGHWYDEYGLPRYSKIKSFNNIEPLHIKIHQSGKEIVKLCDNGKLTLAREKSTELLQLKDQILKNLAILQGQVIACTD